MSPLRRLVVGALVAVPLAAARLAAQDAPAAVAPPSRGLLDRLGGNVTVTNELYDASGIAPRRPGSTWRVQAAPSLRLFGATSVGLDVLLSNEGNEFRQRLPQVGLEPRFRWGTLHLGDFTRDYGAYTLAGLRIRGAGADVTRGSFRASVQGGVSQDAIATTVDGPVYRRTVVAASVGVGRPEERSLDLTIVRALDALRAESRPFLDTLGLDTLPADLRPQAFNRPQSGLVAALAGTIGFLGNSLRLKGEIAGAILTRDRTSPLLNPDSVPAGGLGTDVRASSAADLAWNAEGQYRGRRFGLRAGYERVGAGYNSLGVAYLVNDRQSWNAGGDIRLLRDRLQLQARVQRQEDNLLGQKRFTTSRDVYQAGLVGRIRRATLALTGVRNLAQNDATNDTLLVDNTASVVTGQLSVPWRIGRRDVVLSTGYSWQRNRDANPVRRIPAIEVRTWNVALAVPVGPVTLAPSVNGVTSEGGGAERQENVVGGFRASARFGKGRGSLSAGYNRTFVAAREVSGANAQFGWQLPWDTRLQLAARHQRYGALGARPAFRESYLTTTLSRSF